MQLDPALFSNEAIPPETRAANAAIIEATKDMPNWWDVGAQKVRDARARGEGVFSGASEVRSRALARN